MKLFRKHFSDKDKTSPGRAGELTKSEPGSPPPTAPKDSLPKRRDVDELSDAFANALSFSESRPQFVGGFR